MIKDHALMIGNLSTATSVSTGGVSVFLASNAQIIGLSISLVAFISGLVFYVLNYRLSLERRRESRARHKREMLESAARIELLEARIAGLTDQGEDNDETDLGKQDILG